MKSTDIEKIDRENRRARKKAEQIERKLQSRPESTVGDYIKKLASLFYHDEERIYNIKSSGDIRKLLEQMKQDLPEKSWESVLRKAVRQTGIKGKEGAFQQLQALLS